MRSMALGSGLTTIADPTHTQYLVDMWKYQVTSNINC